jgi:DNA-binding HxlR family transcriptional regulator
MEQKEYTKVRLSAEECQASLTALEDALYVIGGKWRLRIISALHYNEKQRFNELQRSVKGISARMLSNELKQLELNGFIERHVDADSSTVLYQLTKYSASVEGILYALGQWGMAHRKRIQRF